jgi:hypothetical protein
MISDYSKEAEELWTTLLGSTSVGDYLDFPGSGSRGAPEALVLAEKAHNIAITGRGIINGQGGSLDANARRVVRGGTPQSHAEIVERLRKLAPVGTE